MFHGIIMSNINFGCTVQGVEFKM